MLNLFNNTALLDVDFNIRVHAVWELFGTEIWFTDTILYSSLIVLGLTIFALVVRIRMRKWTQVPSTRLQNFIEMGVGMFDGFVRGIMGNKGEKYGCWFFGLFVYILICNLSGLIGFRPPTADVSQVLIFGFSSFIIIHATGIRESKLRHFKSYLNPMNIIGDLAFPLALSFRLFGNILSGVVIMGLVYGMLPIFIAAVGIPAFLHIYFDIFVGCLQPFILCMLSLSFINDKFAPQAA
jgi:F-type H+-transporting ATPase subunit a